LSGPPVSGVKVLLQIAALAHDYCEGMRLEVNLNCRSIDARHLSVGLYQMRDKLSLFEVMSVPGY
jgi:hypothetical protein